MGKYVRGDRIYVLSQITAVDPEVYGKYKVKTHSGKFYVTEANDTLVTDPEQDAITTVELFNILGTLNAMDTEEFHYMFIIYNNTHGTSYDFNDIRDIFSYGMDHVTLVAIYRFYQLYLDSRNIKVGDIVRVLINGSVDSKYCCVLHIDTIKDVIVYTLYDADEDCVYSLSRDDAQIIRYNVAGKETAPIESLFNNIKENISNVTGDIDRSHDDPSENS